MKRLTYQKLYAKGRRVEVGNMRYQYPSLFGVLYTDKIMDANGYPIIKDSYKKEDYYKGRLLDVVIEGKNYLVPFFMVTPLRTIKECDGGDLDYLYRRVIIPEFNRCRISIEEMDCNNVLHVDPSELWEYAKGYFDGLIAEYGVHNWMQHDDSITWVNYCLKRRKSA